MRGRTWIFTLLVAIALALNLARLSLSIAQTGEDTVRAHVALASSALKAQLELLDARLSPRAVALVPELIDATRPPADPTQALGRPDDRALRAAASALSPEPDLLAVASAQGAIISRRARPAQAVDDASQLPFAKAALEGNPAPGFAQYEGATWRMAAARIPGNAAAAVVGTLVDDRFAGQLKSQVDADVTLLQGGKVLASSLPPGEERARLARWAAAPAPGYGVLQIRLPVVGTALSGKLPRGAARYAVRGSLVPLDGGVQAAVTVPSSPYLGWLGRYQAFYLLGLVLFVLFGFLWGLISPEPEPVFASVQREPLPPLDDGVVRAPYVAVRSAPSLLGTDVGEGRTSPPPTDAVPWSAEGPSGEHAEPREPPPPRKVESLDPEMAPPLPESALEEEPQTLSAEEAGLVEAEPDQQAPAGAAEEEPTPPAASHSASSAQKGDFSFSDLLEESHGTPPAEEGQPALEQDSPEATSPDRPGEALLAEARGEAAPEEPFPGDEPTRIEPVSAALLDKLRERDEEARPAAAAQGWGSLVPEGHPPERTQETAPLDPEVAAPAAPAEAPSGLAGGPEANVTMQDFSLPALAEEDPDEQHWRETFDKFKELKIQLGEQSDRITFERFAAKLRKNRADLLAKHSCKGVRFSVYEKDGKAAIKAAAIR